MINYTPLAKEFWEKGRSETCPVYDMHGHMGPFKGIYFPRSEPADMLKSMDSAGVKMLFFCHHSALFSPDIGNKANIAAVRKFPDRFRAYMAVNPNYPEQVSDDLASFHSYRDVFIGLKFLADYHKQKISSEGYRKAWEFADKHKLLVLVHTWYGSAFNGPDEIRICAEKYNGAKMLLGHSCHPNLASEGWDAAIKLAKDYSNIFLELTAVLDDRGAIEKLVEGAGSERLLFGTDLPWFDPHQGIGALLSADITEEACHNILHVNAEKLLLRG